MKKGIRILLFSVLGIAVIVIGFVLFITIAGIPSYENEARDLTVEVTEERVAEGARVAAVLCTHCHASEDGKLGGAYMYDVAQFGEIYAPNITRHPELGITGYTDGELVYLLRTGISKEGLYMPPYMPKFPHLSDEDLFSIVAFLRSDHPLVQPSDNFPGESRPNFLTKFLTRTAFRPLPYPEGPVKEPDPSDKVAWGRYLTVGKFDCFACHSASFQKLDMLNPENSEGFLGGGNPIPDPQLRVILSSNLTMDEETGLGSWTEEEFIRAVRFGMRPDKPPFRLPMRPAPVITEQELSAMWAYLQSVPEIYNPDDHTPFEE